ncbi:MAG: LruC domain-containing protein [Bacteroidales bacterium]|nr:LruC domain-containing protein [Bacteroidales bacterium]
MKKNIVNVLSVSLLVAVMSSCVQNTLDKDGSTQVSDLTIPTDFNWSTVRQINLTVNVDDQYDGKYYYTVEVFDQNPVLYSSAKLLAKGVAKNGQTFSSVVTVPQGLTSLGIRQISPDGVNTVRAVDVADAVSCNFKKASAVSSVLSSSFRKVASVAAYRSITVSDADFPTIIPSNASAYTSGQWVGNGNYILKDGFSGSVNVGSNVIFYVSGKISVSSFYMGSGSKLYLLPGAEANIKFSSSSISQSNTVVSVNNGATLKTESLEISSSAKVLNRGTFQTSGYLRISTTGQLYNSGILSVGSTLSGENVSSYIDNEGGTITAKDFSLNGNSNLSNAGTVTIANKTTIGSSTGVWINADGTYTTKDMEIVGYNKNAYNACKLVVNNLLNLNSGNMSVGPGGSVVCSNLTMKNATINLDSKAIFDVEALATYIYNPKSTGYGFYGTGTDYSLLKIKKAVAEKKNATNIINYGGNLQIECENHPATNVDAYNIRYTYDASVEWFQAGKSTVSIPVSSCSEGNNVSSGGTPTDPTFPLEVKPGISYTYAMEDLWPEYGDYDMNDLVITVTPVYFIDAANHVTSLVLPATLRAVGGIKPIGSAFQLDKISAGDVASVTYSSDRTAIDGSIFEQASSGVETGQTYAVVPLFDNAHKFLGVSRTMTNTIAGGQSADPQTVIATIQLNPSATVSVDAINMENLNFFIVTDGQKTDRTEIHLRGYNPSDKANKTLFGTGVDNSKAGAKYSSIDNLVWGMMIPATFNYPIENTSILSAYPNFKSWAESGGVENQNWYDLPVNGNIYVK